MAEHRVGLELFYGGAYQPVPVLDTPTAKYRRGATTGWADTDPAEGSATIDNTSQLYAPRSVASALFGKIGQNTPARLSADGSVRMSAEVSQWAPQRPVKGSGSTPVELSGILRRLGRGTDDRWGSPLRRSYDHDPGALIAYWPLEEPRGATVAYDTLSNAPAVVGGFTGLVDGDAGAPQFGIVDAGPGSAPIANLAGGWNLDLNIPPAAATGFVSLEFTTAYGTEVRNVGVSTHGIRLDPNAAAKHLQFSIGVFDDGKVNLRWLEADRALNLLAGPTEIYAAGSGVRNIFDGQPRVFALDLLANGGTNVDWVLWENDNNLASGTITPSFAGAMNARAWRASANSTVPANVLAGWGHVAVWNQTNASLRVPAMTAFVGERAADRFNRLLGEEGVLALVVGSTSDTIAMGAQGTGPLLDQLDEIARTDDASIFETRGQLGLTMRTGASKLNQTPALSVTYLGAIKPPLRPVFGDQAIRNYVTARNVDGATRLAVQLTGPNNVQTPGTDAQAVGRYTTTLNVSTAAADVLLDTAGRRLAQGTYDGTWYAAVTVDLDAAPGLTAAVNAVDIGDVVALTELPAEEALDVVESLVIGIAEEYPAKQRWVTFYLIPAAPYRVGLLAADVGDTAALAGRLESDGATVAAAVDPAQFFTDGFEANVVVAWSTQNGWTRAADTAHVRTGVTAVKLTPPGAVASGGIIDNGRHPVTAGRSYVAECWFWSAAGWADCRAAVDWRDAADAVLSSALGVATVVPAGVWTVSRQVFVAPAGAVSAQLRARQGGTPAVTDVLWVDDAAFGPQIAVATPAGPLWTTDPDDFPLEVVLGGQRVTIGAVAGAASPQTFILAAAGRPLRYPIPAGAAVTVYQPIILAP